MLQDSFANGDFYLRKHKIVNAMSNWPTKLVDITHYIHAPKRKIISDNNSFWILVFLYSTGITGKTSVFFVLYKKSFKCRCTIRGCKVWNIGAQLEAASQYVNGCLCMMQKAKRLFSQYELEQCWG